MSVRTVINGTVYSSNPYQSILYSALDGRYELKRGTIADALERQEAGGDGSGQIFHVHWEEAVVRPLRTAGEAEMAAAQFGRDMERFKSRGGHVVWTIHNLRPHELEYPEAFDQVRAVLMRCADRILVHSPSAVPHLMRSGLKDAARIFFLPHPSYALQYDPSEPMPAERTTGGKAAEHTLLLFGMVRRYKAVDKFLQLFTDHGLHEQGLRVRVCGEPLLSDSYGDEIVEAFGEKPGIDLELRRFDDEEVPALFAEADCIVLPYERFLTSGVLLAAMTLGTPVIAPAMPQIREVLPTSQHPYLFDPSDLADSLVRIRDLCGLPREERLALRADILNRAAYYAPHRISMQLGAVYDALH